MPLFRFHLRRSTGIEPDDDGLHLQDLHHTYLEARRAIPDTARDLLLEGRDPMACAFVICDERGHHLMDVPFTEALSPEE